MGVKVTNNAFGTLNGGVSNSATSITLNSITTAMPNNADIHLQSALAVNTLDQSDAMTSTNLYPFAGIYIDDQSTTTARNMRIYNMNLSMLV